MSRVCPSWLSFILYNPLRKRLTDRHKVLDQSRITRDSVVLEIGAGNGFFTEVLARHAGRVVSIELQDGMVRKLKRRVAKFGGQVNVIRADISAHAFEEAFADVCLLYYSFHEVHNKPGAAGNIAGAVKKSGLVALYEPTVEVRKRDMEKTVKLFEEKGFVKEEEGAHLFTRFALMRKRIS
ncbi:MAG: class I SAM-dependent methyltransferase [Nitrospiraceae bacterium]|nr:MAG: class I SAM-dependent methyltransferase [Nitrospiraceae bacterium]